MASEYWSRACTDAYEAESSDETKHVLYGTHGFAIACSQGVNELEHMGAIGTAQHLAHCLFLQLASAIGNGLIGQGQGIAHRAPCSAREQAQWSVAYDDGARAFESAFARTGRWRAEGMLSGEAGTNELRLRLRGGTASYRPLAEPRRAGPPEAAVSI